MDYPCKLSMRHLFNGDTKSGPLLVIECHVNSEEYMAIGHYWMGSGNATLEEIKSLERHWKKKKFTFVSQYIKDRILSGAPT